MEHPALAPFHPVIRDWFARRLGAPTEIQTLAWPKILAGRHVLVTAPTGSGKTLTAFLVALNQLITGHFEPGRLRVLYLSPLKALGNDIRRNLLGPLSELSTLFSERGLAMPAIRVLTRTGDTPNDERRAMLRHPPEILVTTPESLGLMLTGRRAREMFADLEVVILDEIHALAGGKRGTYTLAQVERLTLFGRDVQRIGLSATVHPAARVAAWMGGFDCDRLAAGAIYQPRPVDIVGSTDRRPPAITVHTPLPPAPGPEAKDLFWEALAKELRAIVNRNRSTLIFANSRRSVEKITRLINDGATPPLAYSHHGSLSRELRLDVEEHMKAGELRAIVATGSLELGIDIGGIDEVILLGAPPSIAQTMQRLGRADHRVGGQSKGQVFALHGLDGVEAATLVGLCGQGLLEETTPPAAPLDVLAQVLLSLGCAGPWDLDGLFAFVRRIAAYHDLPRDRFDELLAMLSGRFADAPLRDLRARATVDLVANTFQSRKGTDFVLYQSGGTIPDRGYFNLRLADSRAMLGELDEEFVWERRLGDQFTLGTQAWRILRITHNDVEVGPADPGKPMIPFWKAEEQNRSTLASFALLDFLDTCGARLADPAFPIDLAKTHALPVEDGQRLIAFLSQQREACAGALPGRHDVIIECLAEAGVPLETQQVVLHTFWGGKVNRPLSLALCEHCEREQGVPLEAFATNDQILLLLPDGVDPARIFDGITPDTLPDLLRARLQKTPLFGARFRENAGRALLLPRGDARRRYPLWLRRLRAKKLLATVESLPDFPIVLETWRELIEDDFDLPTLRTVLSELATGHIRTHVARPARPSPFCDGVVFRQTNYHMYLDDSPGPGAGKAPSATRLRELFEDVAPLPMDLVATFARKLARVEPGYEPTSGEDLAFAVREQVFPSKALVDTWLSVLGQDVDPASLANGVLFTFQGGTVPLVCAIGDLPRLLSLRPAESAPVPFLASATLPIAEYLASHSTDGEADDASPLLADFLAFRGPTTAAEITAHLGFSADAISSLADDLGNAVVPCLVEGDPTPRYCDAEHADRLARLHRARRRDLAKREPAPLARLPAFLARWQNLGAAGTGLPDLQAALEPLFGYPLPAEAWEEAILPARLFPYHPSWLDSLFQSFDLAWLGTGSNRLTLAIVNDLDLLVSAPAETDPSPLLASLRADPRGRTLADLCVDGHRPSAETIAEVWRLAGEGLITSTTFETVRRRILGNFKDEAPRPAQASNRRRGFARSTSHEGAFRALPEPAQGTPMDRALLETDRCRLLFSRYGILFRDLLERELPLLRWPRVLQSLRMMELSGEIVAGHFFADIPGLQFATPKALVRLGENDPPSTVVAMNACDPASPCGLGLPAFTHFPKRLPSNTLVIKGVDLLLVLSRGGRDLRAHIPPDHPSLPEALRVFRLFLDRQFHPGPAITVETINGEKAPSSPYAPVLRAFGFRPDYLSLTLSR